VASGGAWLSVTPASGGTSGSASVAVSTTGLAAGAYSGSVTITAAGSTGSPMTVPVTLNVTSPTLTVSPTSLSFAHQIGGVAPAAQTLAISGVATLYTITASGGTWLSVTPGSGGTSGSASVSVNTTGLAAGTYSGSVTILAAGSTGSPMTVLVTLNVTAAPPNLTVSPSSLTFAYQIGRTVPAGQTLNISGVASTYTAVASGGTWLSASAVAGGASVSVNATGLTAGSYSDSVTITATGSTGSPIKVPVTLNVTSPTLTVSPTSLTFTYQIGGTASAAQTLNISGVSSTYTAVASGGAWLSVSSVVGSASVSVNTTGLAAGTYSGFVTIAAAGSTGSPMTVPVTLNVTATPPTLTVSPSSLTFAYQIGGTALAAQSVAIKAGSLTYTAAASGGTWLSVSPASGKTPGSVSVSVNPTGLAAGTYNALVTIAAAGAANGAQVVAVSLLVTSPVPTLQITPATLSFSCASGTVPIPYVLNVASSGSALKYTAAASGGAWLWVAPASGTTPGALFVSVNPAGLNAGTYTGSISFTVTNSPSQAQRVPVTMVVTSATSPCPVPAPDN